MSDRDRLIALRDSLIAEARALEQKAAGVEIAIEIVAEAEAREELSAPSPTP